MTVGWVFFTARCRVLLQYRLPAVTGMLTNIVFGFIRVGVLAAFYAQSTHAQPMSFHDAVAYVWLGQVMLLFVLLSVDPDVREMVRTGSVAYELLRPVDLYNQWFARAVAYCTVPALLRGLPLLVLSWLFFGLELPTPTAAMLFLASLLCTVFLAAAIMNLLNISLLWTISGEGIIRIAAVAKWVFSGFIIPMPLWPDWSQPILRLLPFKGLADVPLRIYSGHIPPGEALLEMALQLVWVAVLVVTGRTLLARGVSRLVVQGG